MKDSYPPNQPTHLDRPPFRDLMDALAKIDASSTPGELRDYRALCGPHFAGSNPRAWRGFDTLPLLVQHVIIGWFFEFQANPSLYYNAA